MPYNTLEDHRKFMPYTSQDPVFCGILFGDAYCTKGTRWKNTRKTQPTF